MADAGGFAENADGGVLCAHDIASGPDEYFQQPVDVVLGAHLQTEFQQCGQAQAQRRDRVQGVQYRGLRHRVRNGRLILRRVCVLLKWWQVGHPGEQLAASSEQARRGGQLFRRGMFGATQLGRNRVDDGLRRRRFADDRIYAAVFSHIAGIAKAIGGGVENDRDVGGWRIGVQALDQFNAIHDRHEYVGDHQMRTAAACQRQCLGAVRCLQHLMVEVAEQGDEEFAIDRTIINNQDGCHAPSP